MLVLSTILISLALVFYSIGVWAERIVKYFKGWHVIAFWCGFLFDVTGTWTMHLMSKGNFNMSAPHTLTGQIALWLMLTHALWAVWVLKKGSEESRIGFHKYSIIVWVFWLIPYFGGMYLGMSK